MRIDPDFHPRRAQRGMALVVALVLLLVMTMVAVVATRTTSIDLKMTTNTVLARRAFQNSEGSRTGVGPVLESHVFYRGWPQSIGGAIPATSAFTLPTEIAVTDVTKMYFEGTNGALAHLIDISTTPHTFVPFPNDSMLAARSRPTATRDLRFRLDVDGDGAPDNEDMFADILVTRTASLLAPGSGAAQTSGYLGPGVGAAGAGAHVFFDLRSRGEAPGNARNVTGADYRVLIRN